MAATKAGQLGQFGGQGQEEFPILCETCLYQHIQFSFLRSSSIRMHMTIWYVVMVVDDL
jgi:hypothetical protein